jgi:hypothetical protein
MATSCPRSAPAPHSSRNQLRQPIPTAIPRLSNARAQLPSSPAHSHSHPETFQRPCPAALLACPFPQPSRASHTGHPATSPSGHPRKPRQSRHPSPATSSPGLYPTTIPGFQYPSPSRRPTCPISIPEVLPSRPHPTASPRGHRLPRSQLRPPTSHPHLGNPLPNHLPAANSPTPRNLPLHPQTRRCVERHDRFRPPSSRSLLVVRRGRPPGLSR